MMNLILKDYEDWKQAIREKRRDHGLSMRKMLTCQRCHTSFYSPYKKTKYCSLACRKSKEIKLPDDQ